MRIVAIEELRRNLAFFLDLSTRGETYLAARKGRIKALVRPASLEDRYPVINAAAFRDRAGRVLREAPDRPRLITWYGKPAAAVVAAPQGLIDEWEGIEE